MTKTIKCPDCEEMIILADDGIVGEIVECQNCGSELEIICLNPPQVTLVVEEK